MEVAHELLVEGVEHATVRDVDEALSLAVVWA